MARIRRRAAVVTLGAALALSTVAACSSDKGGGGGGKGSTSDKKGGTLYHLTKRPVEHWDPQRMYIGRDLTYASRLLYRTLDQLDGNNKLLPDLAEDTGTPSDDNKTWTYKLRTDVKWQDGSPITCEDFRYGVSRTFATDVITGGPNYAIQFLDIPTNKDGSSVYTGPYTKKNQADFDKAVTCNGNTLTFHLSKPVGDFNYAASGALMAFAPFKASQDQGDKSNFQVFASGPYMLQGTWTEGKGGTFVRNPNYDPNTDKGGVRKALPDKYVFVEGLAVETVMDRLIADAGNDKSAVTDRAAPPAYLARIAAIKDRYTDPTSPYVDYLTPNFRKLTNPLVRQALAISTDRQAYIAAEGGSAVAAPAYTLTNPALGKDGGYKEFKAFPDVPDNGDAAKAKQLLQQAGVQIPYPIHYTYSGGTPTTDKQASALKAGWEKAGFKVTLEGLADTYYDVIQNPANAEKHDVNWAGWGADWPNASTVIPPLFDSRVNLTKTSTGQDYGYYQSDATNSAIDAAYNEPDPAKRNAMWGDIDEALAKEVAYIPLDIPKFPRLHGSNVTNYTETAASNGYPDLGGIGAVK